MAEPTRLGLRHPVDRPDGQAVELRDVLARPSVPREIAGMIRLFALGAHGS
jgi:hypothetical protein